MRKFIMLISCLFYLSCQPQPQDNKTTVLASWHDGKAKQAIIDFVSAVSQPGQHFVEPSARIAVFDNDGTLWAEQPMYFQLLFALDEIEARKAQHPEWQQKEPFKSVLNKDWPAVINDTAAIATIMTETHTDMSVIAYQDRVSKWLVSAKHPVKQKPILTMVYQPMLELLDYLRSKQFTIYIVSGGGTDFIRVWSKDVYGIPAQQVIGSRFKKSFKLEGERVFIQRQPGLAFLNDKQNKPIAIDEVIGQRPILAVGNSDGDLPMLQYTAASKRKNLSVYLHHTDAVREWAYDRQSPIGRLDQGLDLAEENNWVIIDMKADWKTIFKVED